MVEPPLFHSVDDACRLLGISKGKLYFLVQDGELEIVKIGRKSVISRADLDAFAKRRIAEARSGGSRTTVPSQYRRKPPIEAAE